MGARTTDDVFIVPAPIIAALDEQDAFEARLPYPGDARAVPAGVTWRVVERIIATALEAQSADLAAAEHGPAMVVYVLAAEVGPPVARAWCPPTTCPRPRVAEAASPPSVAGLSGAADGVASLDPGARVPVQ
ncbi:hypothetical protein [Polymorphospora sp. NPDC050346]|uniref:hypothetical protein n=1 Tax=Polymorphospora sp. NPDC050346 TaxID=3155780 RepID=UPI0033C19A00